MADGSNVDSTKQHGADQPAATTAQAGADNHTAKLQADSQASKPEVGVIKDHTNLPVDKALDKVQDTTEKPGEASYSHLTNAQLAANEIGSYLKQGKKETDTVTVKGDDGQPKTETVGQRVAELKKVVDSECQAAVGQSNSIKQTDLSGLLQTARSERAALAKDLNLSPDKINAGSIAAALKGTTDSATADKLKELSVVQDRIDKFKLWENAPAYTRMLYSTFKASGLTDPETGLQRDPNGGLKASQKDVLDAVQLLTEAGAGNKDLKNSRLYVQAVDSVLPKLENSSPKVQQITSDLTQATAAGAKGDKVTQEKLLKDAVAQADQTNTAAIAQMLRDPKFVASQRNPAVLSDMANNVVMSSTARLEYAQFLMDQGKYGDAQGLVLRVKTECPEVMYNHDPNDPTKLSYNQSRFVDMAKLDQSLASTTVQPNQIKNLVDDFRTAMSNGQYKTKDGNTGAEDIMKQMYAAANKRVADVADGQHGLDAVQKDLDQRRAEVNSKRFLTDEAKTLELKQLDREQMMIQQQKERLAQDAKDANHQLNVVKLYDAAADEDRGDRDAARARLAEVKAGAPELAAEKDPDGKDSWFSTLEKGSVEPGWWDKNWRKVAMGGAVLAGVGVGILTCWTGPGAAIFGAGTTAALMTTIGVGVAGGALAGGTTFLGTHAILHATGAVSEKVNALRDFEQGAAGGASGAFMFMSVPAMAGVTAMGAATESTAAAGWLLQTGRMGLVMASGSLPYGVADYFGKDPSQRSLKTEAITVGSSTLIPMAIPGITAGLRAVNLIKSVAPIATAVTTTRSAITPGSLLFTTGTLGALQYYQGQAEKADANSMGPSYAFNDDGSVGPISQGISLFGPYNYTRTLDPDRQGAGDITGERSEILNNWTASDPGLTQSDKMSREVPVKPIQNTTSDFTDAANLPPPGNPEDKPDQ